MACRALSKLLHRKPTSRTGSSRRPRACCAGSKHQSSLRWPVSWSSTAFGAGPMASTVREPAAICVRPASCTRYVSSPASRAAAARALCTAGRANTKHHYTTGRQGGISTPRGTCMQTHSTPAARDWPLRPPPRAHQLFGGGHFEADFGRAALVPRLIQRVARIDQFLRQPHRRVRALRAYLAWRGGAGRDSGFSAGIAPPCRERRGCGASWGACLLRSKAVAPMQ